MGAILKQTQPDAREKQVAYFSKKLNETQKRKKAIYLEYHKPLENLNITDEELGDLTYYLSQFDFSITYILGKLNTEADSLSRNPVLEAIDSTQETLKIVNTIKIQEIKKDQNENITRKELKEKTIDKHVIIYKQSQAKYGLMSQLGPATKPFEIVSIDTIGGFDGRRSTKRYLHLLVDH
ncbi:Hypothetical protein CINCED_3A012389 [Cinara cedri]|uniref:Uncharacterized protein n=1 Tax=Cinara cedri TaxID=506608 RepID=A0A5E4MHU3_9HEMI|nr:Hypothetical protein CINCED_3A012389 [Cinara cedri]